MYGGVGTAWVGCADVGSEEDGGGGCEGEPDSGVDEAELMVFFLVFFSYLEVWGVIVLHHSIKNLD